MSVLFTDSGVGTDANPIGGNYTTVPGLGGYAAFQRLTNQFSGTGSGDCASYVNSVSPPADGYCEIAIQSVAGGADDGGPMFRVNTTTGDCYMTDWDGTNVGTFWFNGASHTLIAGTVVAGAVGDKFRTVCQGSTISSQVNGVTKTSVIDTNISAAGRGGIFGHASGFKATLLEIGDFASVGGAKIGPFHRAGPGMGPELRRMFPQRWPDSTAFPVPENFNYRQPIPRKGRGPGRLGPAGRMKPQQFPDNPTISANVGTWNWRGVQANLSAQINASVGGWSWQGKTSPLSKQINAGVGSYSWQGKTSPLSTQINAGVGSYFWQGKQASLSVTFNASVGSYSWRGTTANLGGATTINALVGAWAWSGIPAQIQQIITISAQIGVYSWGGRNAQIVSTQVPSKGLAQYGVSFRRKRSQMDEPPDLDVRSALNEVLIKNGLIEKVEYSVSVKPEGTEDEIVEVKASGISQRDLQAIIIALLVSDL